MTTQKLTKYLAKRHVATREDPTAAPVVLGFVKARTMTEAAEKATSRWGIDGENELMVLVPLGDVTKNDLRLAFLAEADAAYGPSFGKRRKFVCDCKVVCFVHPGMPLKAAQCLMCNRLLAKHPWVLVDMNVEYAAMNGGH